MSTETTPRTLDRIYVSNGGNVVCSEHGGQYLKFAITDDPEATAHITPLDYWDVVKATDPEAPQYQGTEGSCCEWCGATLAVVQATPTVSAEDIAEAIGFGTEYEEKRATLARQFHAIGSPGVSWDFAPDAHQDAYYADATAVLATVPRLLSHHERERLTPFLPALALTVEEIATGELGTVEDSDPEWLICVCGAHAHDGDFVSATAEGIAIHVEVGARPEALAERPKNSAKIHMLCRKCGRLYRELTIHSTNTAPVVLRVDLTDGTPAHRALLALDAP